jgi:hypothetical protein
MIKRTVLPASRKAIPALQPHPASTGRSGNFQSPESESQKS